jgi:hypothetical protein
MTFRYFVLFVPFVAKNSGSIRAMESSRVTASRKFVGVLLVLLAGSFAAAALGQDPAVKVSGIVVDWQYARVLPTTIVFKSELETKEVKVDDQGSYEVELSPGLYIVEATAPNFRKRRVRLQVEPATHRILNLMLDVVPQNFHCPKGSICL